MKIIKLTLAERDKCLMNIESQIETKKNNLLEKQKKINKNIKFNQLLENIRNDYQKYYDYIIQQKREQIQAMNILNNYIRELKNSGNLSENNLKDASYEEKKILNEIKQIEHHMNHLLKQLQQASNSIDETNTNMKEQNNNSNNNNNNQYIKSV